MKTLFYIGLICSLLMLTAASGECTAYSHKGFTPGKKITHKKTLAPEKVAIAFTKWYCKNMDRLDKYRFFNIDTTGDTTKMHSVNMHNVMMYLDELRKTKWVSNDFLFNIQTKYVNASYYLQVHPQNDGPVIDIQKTFAISYDSDPVIEIMETEMLSDNINKLQVRKLSIQSNLSVVVLRASTFYPTYLYCTNTTAGG